MLTRLPLLVCASPPKQNHKETFSKRGDAKFPEIVSVAFPVLSVLWVSAVLFNTVTNVSKAQESTTAKIDDSQMYVMMTDNIPIKGKKNTVYMGDSMLQQRHGMYVDCLIPLFNDEAKKLGGWT